MLTPHSKGVVGGYLNHLLYAFFLGSLKQCIVVALLAVGEGAVVEEAEERGEMTIPKCRSIVFNSCHIEDGYPLL